VFATAAALCAAAIGIGAAVLPWRAIAPIARPDVSVYSAATIARGQQLAALGDCAVCHTSANGVLNAGGRPLPTPFGTIFSTNITPDVGNRHRRVVLSRLRGARCAREFIATAGISIRHSPTRISPRTTDADMQALYAISDGAVASAHGDAAECARISVQRSSAAGGMGTRCSISRPCSSLTRPSPRYWNRGAYLVEGLGHCSACHSPRNALGAEKANAYLAGGFAEGWEAPALTSFVGGVRSRGARLSFTLTCEPASRAFTASPPGQWRPW